MRQIAILIPMLLFGCVRRDDWMNAAERYVCTETQMQKAASETLFCKKESSYSDTYCYQAAIMRNCEPKRSATTSVTAGQEGGAE